MTQKPIPDDLKISSPMGDIVVPTESLKEVLTYFTNNIEKTDHMDANISEFFGCDVKAWLSINTLHLFQLYPL